MRENRSDIDILKSIAIFFVVFYHLFDLLKSNLLTSVTIFESGFLGVDIFLVVSGFLITGSIVSKLNQNDFSLLSFYKRRVSRIYPPLLFVCAFVLIVGYFLLFPIVYKETTKEVVNTLIGVANYRFANSGGYFAFESVDKILLHTWYIAITLQFYLIFPILIKLFSFVSKNHINKFVLLLTVVLTVVAFVCAKDEKGYLVTQCRIFEIFIGASLYMYKDSLKTLVQTIKVSDKVLHYVALTLLLITFFTMKLNNGLWYVTTSIPTVIATALVIIANYNDSVFNKNYLTYLGKISYSLYLWHWPILVFAIKLGLEQNLIPLILVFIIIAAFTLLSYNLLEKKKVHFAISLCMLVLCALPYFTIKDNSFLKEYVIEKDVNFVGEGYTLEKYIELNNNFVYKISRDNKEINTFVIGDSHSGQYHKFFYFDYENPIYYMTVGGRMAYGPIFTKIGAQYGEDYYKLYTTMLDELKDNSRIVLSNNWFFHYDTYYLNYYNLKDSKENFSRYLDDMISDLDTKISDHKNLKFYIVGQSIYTTSRINSCTGVDLSKTALRHIIDQEKCFIAPDYLGYKGDLINERLKAYADTRDNVFFIDRNEVIRNKEHKGMYTMVTEDKKPVYADRNHYTNAGAKFIGRYIMNIVDNQ